MTMGWTACPLNPYYINQNSREQSLRHTLYCNAGIFNEMIYTGNPHQLLDVFNNQIWSIALKSNRNWLSLTNEKEVYIYIITIRHVHSLEQKDVWQLNWYQNPHDFTDTSYMWA
jgi:hypothetical protein